MQYTSVNSLLPMSGTASLQAAVYDQGEQKTPGTAGRFMWQSGKTQNSTIYYYNHSGAREQEGFLLEYDDISDDNIMEIIQTETGHEFVKMLE